MKIHVYDIEVDIWYRSNSSSDSFPYHHRSHEIFPLQEYEMNGIKVNVAYHPIPYLDKSYGEGIDSLLNLYLIYRIIEIY
jgi:hypothetical protein